MLIESLRGAVVLNFLAYVVLSVAGLVLLRANLSDAAAAVRLGELTRPAVLISALGASCYAVSFALWLIILANVPLSQAYPLAVGSTLAFSSILAWLLLDERMSVRLVAGIMTIFAGVVLISTS